MSKNRNWAPVFVLCVTLGLCVFVYFWGNKRGVPVNVTDNKDDCKDQPTQQIHYVRVPQQQGYNICNDSSYWAMLKNLFIGSQEDTTSVLNTSATQDAETTITETIPAVPKSESDTSNTVKIDTTYNKNLEEIQREIGNATKFGK